MYASGTFTCFFEYIKRGLRSLSSFIRKNCIALLSLFIAFVSLAISLVTHAGSFVSSELHALIIKEARVSLEGDVKEAISLFHPDAVIRDWGGYNPNVSHPQKCWRGVEEIHERYMNLPQFSRLVHVDINVIEVQYIAGTARAASSSDGKIIIKTVGSAPTEVGIASFNGDIWEFRKINKKPFQPWTGEWKISSFTYDYSK